MGRSSKSITLALIGSALMLSGCADEEEDQDQNANQVAGAGRHSGGVFIAPMIGGGYRGGGMSSPGASARGGFGATGSVGVGS